MGAGVAAGAYLLWRSSSPKAITLQELIDIVPTKSDGAGSPAKVLKKV